MTVAQTASSFDPHAGTLCLAPFQLPSCPRLRLTAQGEMVDVAVLKDAEVSTDGKRRTFRMRYPWGEATLFVDAEPPESLLRLTLRASVPIRLHEAHLVDLSHDWSCFWETPPTAWGEPAARRLTGVPAIGYDVGGLFDPSGDESIAIGHAWPTTHFNELVATNRRFYVRSRIERDLFPGETWTSDTLVLNTGESITGALARFGRHRQSCRRAPSEVADHSGWNTWDSYHQDIDIEVIRENLEAARRTPAFRKHLRYFIIDDGWQTYCGDWQAHPERFPEGMAAVAAEIREAGFVPGLWSAPFLANRHSALAASHPEWFLRIDDDPYSPWHLKGNDPPWGDRCHLDPSHPEVADFVGDLYRRLHEEGFGYFKTDFLCDPIRPLTAGPMQAYASRLRYHNDSVPPLAAHRRCMESIRAAIGEESFWLGCGSYYATGAGLMDASRISADIGPSFPPLKKCASSILWNFHLHGAAFLSDPDFAIFRGPETARDTDEGFTRQEAELWATLLILSGGMITLSDPLAKLNEAGLAIAKTVLEHAGGDAAVPVAPDAERPCRLLKDNGNRHYLGLFNWSDEAERELPLTPAPAGRDLTDLWSGETMRHDGGGRLSLPPRSCRLLVW